MKPLATEKAIRKIETENIMTFVCEKNKKKEDIKKELEEVFEIKVDKIRTLIRGNKKYAYVKLNKKFLAIDLATKLGLM